MAIVYSWNPAWCIKGKYVYYFDKVMVAVFEPGRHEQLLEKFADAAVANAVLVWVWHSWSGAGGWAP